MNIKKLRKNKNKTKNHLTIGDFNIDLLNQDNYSNEYLCKFLDKGYHPGFQDSTKPSDSINPKTSGTCIMYSLKLIQLKQRHSN